MYFIKPCPHCKHMLFRVEKMSAAWSECRNSACPFVVNQVPKKQIINGHEWTSYPDPYIECYNRR